MQTLAERITEKFLIKDNSLAMWDKRVKDVEHLLGTVGDHQVALRQKHEDWKAHEAHCGQMAGETESERFLEYLCLRECVTLL